MKSIFNQNKIYIILHALFFCVAVSVIFSSDKLQLHSFFNSLVKESFNSFFKYITYIGDGAFIILFAVALLFFNVQKALTVLFSYLISAGFTQAIKYAFFSHSDRPFLVFEMNHIPLKLVEGVDMNIHNSFPSGHTTAAFSLFFCLSLFTPNNYLKTACFFAALLVAFSRVYLSQHFFEDITVGSLIGVLFTWLVCAGLYQTGFSETFNKLQKPVWKIF